jgi:hypothetical protein
MEATCEDVSAELLIASAAHGDINAITDGVSVLDIARVVDHIKGRPYATMWPPEPGSALFKPWVHVRPNMPDPLNDSVGILDVATVVDAVKGQPYKHFGDFGPCTDGCPDEPPCQ